MSRMIDALVAVKLMGYKWYRAKECEWLCTHPMGKESLLAHFLRQNAAYLLGPGQEVSTCSEEVNDGSGMSVMSKEFRHMPGCGGWGMPKPYSTDIASAWEVVEKMGETHWQRIKKPSPSRGDSEHWQVMFHKKYALDGGKGINKSVCLAICLAALCAVGVPESQIEEAKNQTKGTQ